VINQLVQLGAQRKAIGSLHFGNIFIARQCVGTHYKTLVPLFRLVVLLQFLGRVNWQCVILTIVIRHYIAIVIVVVDVGLIIVVIWLGVLGIRW